jgi:hypothetical protein
LKKIIVLFLIIIFGSALSSSFTIRNDDDREIKDESYKFAFTLPSGWTVKDRKETEAKDGISYSFQKDDTACALMLLAFKINAVKNLDDFIYTIEKDASLNIPQRDGDYILGDANYFDWKIAHYKDVLAIEKIYYFRTKEPDAPNNFVYVMRFITDKIHNSDALQKQISKIADTFVPTPQ